MKCGGSVYSEKGSRRCYVDAFGCDGRGFSNNKSFLNLFSGTINYKNLQKPMPKKYILQHDTFEFNKGTIFVKKDWLIEEEGCSDFHWSIEEIKNFSYWFSEVKEESPEEIIARLEKENKCFSETILKNAEMYLEKTKQLTKENEELKKEKEDWQRLHFCEITPEDEKEFYRKAHRFDSCKSHPPTCACNDCKMIL